MKVSGLLKGTPDGKFNPKANLTRAELATILTRLDFYMETGELYDFNKAYDIILNAEHMQNAKKNCFARLVYKTHKVNEIYDNEKGILSYIEVGYNQELVMSPLNDGNGFYASKGKEYHRGYTEKSSKEIDCTISDEELIKEIISDKYNWTWDKVGQPGYIIPVLVEDPLMFCRDYDLRFVDWFKYSELKELSIQGRFIYDAASFERN